MKKKERHELAAVFNVDGEVVVYIRDNLIDDSGQGGTQAHESPGRRHKQRGVDAMVGDVPYHDAQALACMLSQVQIVVVVTTGFVTV